MIPQMEKAGYPRVFANQPHHHRLGSGCCAHRAHNAVAVFAATGGHEFRSAPVHGRCSPGLLLGFFSLIILCLAIAYRDKLPMARPWPQDALKITIDAAWGMVTLVIISRRYSRGSHCDRSRRGRLHLGVFRDHSSSTGTIAGATARLLHRTLRTVAMVLTLIACRSSVGYIMALTQMPGENDGVPFCRYPATNTSSVSDQHPAAGASAPWSTMAPSILIASRSCCR